MPTQPYPEEGPRYVYLPTKPREEARERALERMIRTFFDGSAVRAAAAILELESADASEEELEELVARIEAARQRGR